tara:strand:+ start:69 stop:455 length:387 start_codon:yes stop_codon:yes gene_type:complete
MRNHKNHRRHRFRNSDRNFRQNGNGILKANSEMNLNSNFQRRYPGKNNHNATKLIEKYNNLAREALSNGDKILSESYYQHADHFLRVSEQKKVSQVSSKSPISDNTSNQTDKKEISEKQNESETLVSK